LRFGLTVTERPFVMPSAPLPRPRGPSPSATFGVSRTAGVTVLTAVGELDITVTAELGDLLAAELAQRPPVLAVDAGAVTFCAARALTVLINAATDALAAGVPFVLVTRRRAVLRPLIVLGLQPALPVYRDVGEALSWLELLPRLTDVTPG
jgi:anti-sigma B factor antagonist